MTNDDKDIIDAEIVENLPAVQERRTYQSDEPIKTQRDWPHGPTPERRCRAHSSRTGAPCKNAAIKGATVCRFHGGAAKQVKANARARLENAADLMARKLLGIAVTGDSEAVRLAAIKDALDRAGLKAPSEVVLSQADAKPYEEVFDSIATGTRAESRAARGVPDLPASAEETLGRHRTSAAGEAHAPSFTQGETGDQTQPPTPSPPWAGTFETGPPPQAFDTYTTGHINDGTGWPDAPPQPPSAHAFGRERGNQATTRHIVGDEAVAEAGRLAHEQRAIMLGHKKYLRP